VALQENVYTPHTAAAAGDANRDGRFDQADIVAMLAAGKYQTGQPATWADGDFTGDGVFDQNDLVMALQSGHYQSAAESADAAFAQLGV